VIVGIVTPRVPRSRLCAVTTVTGSKINVQPDHYDDLVG
jgi:hypothetical protein